MIVYNIRAFDGGDLVNYFEPTKKAAKSKASLLKSEGYNSIEITEEKIICTKIGIAEKLQNIIDRYCLNEH